MIPSVSVCSLSQLYTIMVDLLADIKIPTVASSRSNGHRILSGTTGRPSGWSGTNPLRNSLNVPPKDAKAPWVASRATLLGIAFSLKTFVRKSTRLLEILDGGRRDLNALKRVLFPPSNPPQYLHPQCFSTSSQDSVERCSPTGAVLGAFGLGGFPHQS